MAIILSSLPDAFETKTDTLLGYERVEYHCKKCGGHHGHIFEDGPNPTGKRYCNNGVCLTFKPKEYVILLTMLIKYISFLIGVIWSYSIIKTQSVFNNKAGLIFKIFITKVSWFTLIAACYFGYKNFTIKSTVVGLIVGVLLVNVSFYLLKKKINQRFNEKSPNTF